MQMLMEVQWWIVASLSNCLDSDVRLRFTELAKSGEPTSLPHVNGRMLVNSQGSGTLAARVALMCRQLSTDFTLHSISNCQRRNMSHVWAHIPVSLFRRVAIYISTAQCRIRLRRWSPIQLLWRPWRLLPLLAARPWRSLTMSPDVLHQVQRHWTISLRCQNSRRCS